MIKVTCYGPRGSVPAPSRKGFSTIEYGGNTSCYYVEAGPFRIILDHGSGALVLGDDIMKAGLIGKHFIALSSHYHWDHIQGMPFCVPYFLKQNTFHIHGHEPPGHEGKKVLIDTVEGLIAEQQAAPHFPVAHHSLPSKRIYHSHPRQFSESFMYFVDEKDEYQMVVDQMVDTIRETLPPSVKMDFRRWMRITTIPVSHPDGCLGFRIDYMGDSFTYCTDHEPARHTWAAINRIGKGTNFIVLDGQYNEQQLGGMTQSFGHGSPRSCVEQAVACGAKHVLIHHHDPKHDDTTVQKMEEDAIQYAKDAGTDELVVEFAREGKSWVIGQ